MGNACRSKPPTGLRSRVRTGLLAALLVLALAPAGAQAGHGLVFDHPAPSFSPGGPPSAGINAGGEGAEWELIDTISTGNPHTDLDFFTQGGEIFASAGTLAIGPNGGGQTIIQLTENGEVSPGFVAGHPSATCVSNPAAATGLQHDVESTPKGTTLLNTPNPFADRSDTQLLIDASDAEGRCHDQGILGLSGAPQGGLEIIDVTDPSAPVEIGLTSHIGEAHTVNIDPKRPHIAYAVTSDTLAVNADGVRQNENPASADRFDLDGFEVVDLSSCMNFAAGTSVDNKRAACLPQVYRYRYPTVQMAQGHTSKGAIFGCHELEIYPDDRLTCGSGNTLIALDMSNAFNDMGTPTDFSDDKPRGTPLPCKVRPSSSEPPFGTGAQVIDCVDGTNDEGTAVGGVAASQDLTIPGWIAQGSPSLVGVQYLGSIYHQGRSAGAFDSTEDIDFNHEAELTGSGDHLIATDERGGGITPPGASCTPGTDNKQGNGGVHFYDFKGLRTAAPNTPEQAFKAYARTPEGEKAIFRAEVRTKPQATVCTAHVFQQIPGENRIFMGWYSQGTQVIDFVENSDGTVTFAEAGHFIPENANEWVSSVFKVERNADGSSTYYGAAADFSLGEAGRNSIDVYKVTFPPAPLVSPGAGGGNTGPGGGPGGGAGGAGASGPDACVQQLLGTKSKDRLLGSIAGDRINGGKGNDRIKGREGQDCVKGGGGNDRLSGDEDDDTVNGGGGKDSVTGGDGSDLLKGGRGADRLKGGAGADELRTKNGSRDRANCGKGRDIAVVDKRDRVSKSCEKVKGLEKS